MEGPIPFSRDLGSQPLPWPLIAFASTSKAPSLPDHFNLNPDPNVLPIRADPGRADPGQGAGALFPGYSIGL